MKRLFCFSLIFLCLFSLLGAVYAGAFFGSASECLARDVVMIKTGISGQRLSFSDGDFKSALCLSDFDSLTVTRLPASSDGTLMLGDRGVKAGEEIKRRNLPSLSFIPASEELSESQFYFTVKGQAGGCEILCKMKFIDRVNSAPRAEGLSDAALTVSTQEDISVFGKMNATDPEGDDLEFIIASYPKNGYITVIDEKSGSYKYTPVTDFTGYDSFTYVARDSYGNYSLPVSVTLKVTKRMSSQVFRDMTDRAEYNAAIAMSALGIMNGRVLGDDCFFQPDEAVTRAEFLAMAMKAAGIKAKSSEAFSFFDDGEDIPPSLVGYVVAAERMGIVSGELKDGKLRFRPKDSITGYEAAGIISKIMGLKDSYEETEYSEDEGVPVWARSSVSAMYTLGIFDYEGKKPSEGVTRAEAAEYLYRFIQK